MKIPKRLRPGFAVEILWVDSTNHEAGSWMPVKELIEKPEIYSIRSVGIVILITENIVRLCGCHHESKDYEPMASQSFDIPICSITSFKRLEPVNK
ncbi:MAG: hypothetical protein WC926_05385 [Candidatus Paceibacterota bacterium]|jgi:hypothetical protein